MAYSELIKDFGRIRGYMREFYVYGFKSREEYDGKSSRSYDNERRRMESWLGDYMSFRRDGSGKNVFLSVDSRAIPRNPLYKAFKAKSFTPKDITLHFYILDLLADGRARSARDIAEGIAGDYLARFPWEYSLDDSTVRKKLKEYADLGLLTAEKAGREVLYRRADGAGPDLSAWAPALAFFAEADPLGLVGSFLLDQLGGGADLFRFKHHYLLHAMDSEVLCQLLSAMQERRAVELTLASPRTGSSQRRTVCPLKIYAGIQSGRRYLLGYHYRGRRMTFFRLDSIQKVVPGEADPRYGDLLRRQGELDRHLWGVSTGGGRSLTHIELTLCLEPGEDFILQRLEREKRHGRVERLSPDACRFTADVYDGMELLPWLRTFIGRITDLSCSDPAVSRRFFEDLGRMAALYGGDGHAVP